MAGDRFVAVVGARALPEAWAPRVAAVVRCFLGRGWGIGSGGARGADQFALEAVLGAGRAACARSVVFLPGGAASRGGALGAFAARGGRLVPGAGSGRGALLARSRRLAEASSGVVAFLWGESRGSVYTVRCAVRAGKPAAVVLAGGGAALPAFAGGAWVACRVGGVEAFRWVAAAQGVGSEVCDEEPKRTALHRIFVVPEGEPVESLLRHVSGLSQGERLWFEQGVVAGDTVLVPHEALSDTPAWLAVQRLRRRFRCGVREAAGLAELLLALDAGREVVAWCEAEARRRGVEAVMEELVGLVASLALVEEVGEGDALIDAERLGDSVELVGTDGRVVPPPAQPDADSFGLAWHAVGSVVVETVRCPWCGAEYENDDEGAELPACPVCGVVDTWEARQGAGFRAVVGEIDGCASLASLAAVGKRLYRVPLSRDQAGVAWTRYQLRKATLEAAVALGGQAQVLVREIERAPAGAFPALGARLYRVQHASDAMVTPAEWRRIWAAYHARRRPRAA